MLCFGASPSRTTAVSSATPWKEQYGFTKPKYVPCDGADNRLALRKICSYVSKYVTKGTWEVPVVAAGLMERCYRCISNGIGAGAA